ncbi:MAG: hypothetical protein K8L97_14515 [Anaerolineae bacterium]|nr:hypothetical protein [Anaerolineae bacterium]
MFNDVNEYFIQTHQNDLLLEAEQYRMAMLVEGQRPPFYAHLLAQLGDELVTLGTHLRTTYREDVSEVKLGEN